MGRRQGYRGRSGLEAVTEVDERVGRDSKTSREVLEVQQEGLRQQRR